MSKQDFISLYEKFLSGKCSDEEKKLLETYYAEIKLMDNQWENSLGDEDEIRKAIISRIQSATDYKEPQIRTNYWRYGWLGYAASILLVVTAGLISWYYFSEKQQADQTAKANKHRNDIHPGSNQAYLKLASGVSIMLQGLKNGEISNSANIKISKVSDSIITYSANQRDHGNPAISADSNSLVIPKGGIFQTILSDGTKVWLNSASSLKYPVAFAGKERRVVLSGEAYFEVAKNKNMPFKVSVNGVDVQVLGTHFNVLGYPDETEIKTTLLEGSVKLQSTKGQALLVPGEQGVFSQQRADFTINKVNTEDAVSWKEGFFVFDNESIQSIMPKIARWYNVEVVYQDKPGQSKLGGTISRYKDINTVLKALESTGAAHFKIQGRRVIVMA